MKILVQPYDSRWPVLYDELRQQLAELLADLQPVIQHIGSTAVPGLAAKPVIDIAVGLSALSLLDQAVDPMLRAGFLYYKAFNESMPERRLFVIPDATAPSTLRGLVFRTDAEMPHELVNRYRLAHVHVWVHGSPEWRRHLIFRDYLRQHPEVARAYATLKLGLAGQEWEHGMAYNRAKHDFLQHHQAAALRLADARPQAHGGPAAEPE